MKAPLCSTLPDCVDSSLSTLAIPAILMFS